MRYRLGIDIGGTNTDAAVLDEENRILAKGKTAGRAARTRRLPGQPVDRRFPE